MRIEYRTQRLSYRFFLLMLGLFAVQVVFGLVIAAQRVDPALLAGTLNFNVARSEHTNLGILWILSGFIGTILFVGPLLSKRELASPWLAKTLFWALAAVVAWNVLTLGLSQRGIAGWWAGQPWLQEGLEYVDAGRGADLVILVGFAMLATIVLRTFPPMRQWNEIHWGLGIGVTALTAVWVFGLFFVPRIDGQEYLRWFVVHYWVEGVWEVIHISLIGFLIVLMFGANVRSVGYAVFWGVTFVWLSGLLGNAHHYFWIGTPDFWQFWGSLFSALEPLPLVFCFWHIYLDAHLDRRPLANAPAFYFILGSVVLEQVGAGILGFTMTFALTNVWSHGTWVTPSHAHLALFGTFGMLGIAAAYYAIPLVRGIERFDQRLGKLGFWLLFAGMLGMSLAFALGGTVQVHVYRTLGLDWFGGDVFTAMMPYQILVPVFGFVFAIGAIVVVYDLYTLAARDPAHDAASAGWTASAHGGGAPVARHGPVGAVPARAASGWSRPLGGFEAGTWLLAMWIFGAIITLGLLAFNLPSVRSGESYLPLMLAFIGYPGLLATTLLFVWRFLASMEARVALAPPREAASSAHAIAGGFVALGPLPSARADEAAEPGTAAPA